MTTVGRAQLVHPALGASGGSSLHADIETIYTTISNSLAGRYFELSAVADSSINNFDHEFGVQFADLSVNLYTGTYPALTKVSDPAASGWTIAAAGGGLEKRRVVVTAPSSGGPHTGVLFLVHGGGARVINDLSDVDTVTSAPADGQFLIYDNASSNWKPYYLKFKSETAALSSATITPTTGANIQRITSGSGDINMIASPVDGKVLVLINETGSDLTVKNDTGATAANRIYTGTGNDFILKTNASAIFAYDAGISRWVVAGGSGGGGLTLSPKSTTFTAVAGNHYLTDTSSGGYTATLPAGATGAVVRFSDALDTWNTGNLTITPASGEKIDGLATNESLVCDVQRSWVELSWNGSRWVINAPTTTTFANPLTTLGDVIYGASGGTLTRLAGNTATTRKFLRQVGDATNSAAPSWEEVDQVKGRTSGAVISAGYVGEILTASLSDVSLAVSATVYNAGSLSLTAGVWMVYGKVQFGVAGSTQTQCDASISLTSATHDNTNRVRDNSSGISAGRYLAPCPLYVNVSSTTTVYLCASSSYTGAAPSTTGAQSALFAVRIS